MKKFLLSVATFLLTALLAFGFAACEGDESGKVGGGESYSGSESYSSSSENTAVQYVVTYNANGGAFADEKNTLTATVSANATLTAPESPKKENYTFDGWSTSALGLEKWNFATDKVTKDVTLYAVWKQQSAAILSVDGASIEEQEIFLFVDKNVDSVSLAGKVVCSDDSVWKLYYDKLGQMEIPTKIAASASGSLNNGDNVFYMVVTSKDGTQTNLYELKVHRSYAVSVKYYDGETLLKTETAYTGYEYEANYTPKITGYAFNGWNYTAKVLWDNLNLYADKTAHTYTVTYNVNGGDELTNTGKTVTYGSDYTLAKPIRTGYTFLGWYQDSTQLTDENGKSLAAWKGTNNLTATAKWQANEYNVVLKTNNSSAGTVTGAGEQFYANNVTIVATTNIGYAWLGWYDTDEQLVTTALSYTFKMGFDVTYTAKWNIMEDIQAFDFTSSDYTCTITGIKDKTATEIVVPDYVTEIQAGAFKGCEQLENITLPFIGRSRGSTSYEAVLGYIFGYNYVIDDWYKAPSNTVTQLTVTSGKYTYYYYYFIPLSLRSVTINDGKIPAYAFKSCNFLTEISIPLDVTNIGDYAFSWCSGLTQFTLPEKVTSLGDYAFSGCSGLTQFTLPEKVASLGDYAFSGCSGLTHIEVSESLKTVGDYAFENCTQLTRVELPETITLMGEGAFKGCNSLVSLTIPFVGAQKRTTLTEAEWAYNSVFGYIFGWETSTTHLDDISGTVEQFWTSNSTYYYYYVPTALKTITVLGGVIGKYAFQSCDNLTSVVLGDNVAEIGNYAFEGCSKLESVTIGKSLTYIGTNAFFACNSLTSVYYTGDIAGWCDIYGVRYLMYSGMAGDGSIVYNEIDIYIDNTLLAGELIIPEGVTRIRDYAFAHCSKLTSITIPDSVTQIDDYAFAHCSNLTNIIIPDTVKDMKKSAFYNTGYYKTESNWVDGVLYIGNYLVDAKDTLSGECIVKDGTIYILDDAFAYCESLTSIIIPDSVTRIESPFYGCSNLTIYCEVSSQPSGWSSVWNSNRPVIWGYTA